jgi:hypothetical protein
MAIIIYFIGYVKSHALMKLPENQVSMDPAIPLKKFHKLYENA